MIFPWVSQSSSVGFSTVWMSVLGFLQLPGCLKSTSVDQGHHFSVSGVNYLTIGKLKVLFVPWVEPETQVNLKWHTDRIPLTQEKLAGLCNSGRLVGTWLTERETVPNACDHDGKLYNLTISLDELNWLRPKTRSCTQKTKFWKVG